MCSGGISVRTSPAAGRRELLPTYVGTYGHFGALTAAERELPYLLGARRADDFDSLRDTLFWFVHGVGVLLALGLAVVVLALRSRITEQTFAGLLLYAPILWAQLAATYYVVLYRARKRFGELSARQGGSNVTSIICSGIFYIPNVLSTVMYPRFH